MTQNSILISVGMEEWSPEKNERINKNSSNMQVPPSFVLIFSNFIMLALAKRDIMLKDRTVHAEQYIDIIRPLKSEGVITYELKVVEIIDKGKGTFFTFHCELEFVRLKYTIFNSI